MKVITHYAAYLQNSFEKFGEIKNVKIINSVKTKKPKRFAIVTFTKQIPSAILMQDHWIMGRKVDVKEYLSGEEANNKLSREKQRKVFVGGLPLTVNNEILKGYFQQFGKVIEANIVYNHETMRSRGFGFVIFQDEHTVQEVLKRYDDHYLYGKWVKPIHKDRMQACPFERRSCARSKSTCYESSDSTNVHS